ncbi:MAG: hypothetical protein ACSHWQ_00090 [Spongiibacteraceae bacterium]
MESADNNEAQFKPSKERLEEIAEQGAELLLSASKSELFEFSE